VLLNLTTNAIKFTHEGGSVEVLADSVSRDAVEISVRDTGRGVSVEQQAQLFQPFQKSPGREGFFFAPSGLGLSIVRRLLEKMDSELIMESTVGQGTRFSFVLRLPTSH
jgi:signal transduction histidine kinase